MRYAFTLVEIAFSIAVFTVAIVATVLMLPAGIKAQQMARYRVLAAAKALEIIDSTANQPFYFTTVQSEGRTNHDVPVNGCSNAADLEQLAINYRSQVIPLPSEIASRLDSDNNEIQNILDDGGRLFYFSPLPTSGLSTVATAGGIEGTQRQLGQNLVFAVRGYPQLNGLNTLPMLGAPYYTPYPGPPTPDKARPWSFPSGSVRGMRLPTSGTLMPLWEEQAFPSPTPRDLFRTYVASVTNNLVLPTGGYPYELKYRQGSAPSATILTNAVNLFNGVFASNYAGTGGANSYTGCSYAYPPTSASDPMAKILDPDRTWFYPGNNDPLLAAKVITMSYFAHVKITAAGNTQTAETIALHEASLKWSFYHQSYRPYDLRIQRPYNRPLSMDAPLCQYDPLGDTILDGSWPNGANPANSGQWRSWPIAMPAEISNNNLMLMPSKSLDSLIYADAYPSTWTTANPWSGSGATSLSTGIEPTTPWSSCDHIGYIHVTNQGSGYTSAPSVTISGNATGTAILDGDRVSQIQITAKGSGYVSAPTITISPPGGSGATATAISYLPSRFTLTAPFSSAERCRQIVFWAADWQSYDDFESAPSATMDSCRMWKIPARNTATTGYSANDIFWVANPDSDWMGIDGAARIRNPELTLVWLTSARTSCNAQILSGPQTAPVELGWYGADRNGNGKFDRGPTPKTTRIRALLVSRFNFYDKRLQGSLRF